MIMMRRQLGRVNGDVFFVIQILRDASIYFEVGQRSKTMGAFMGL